MSNNAINPEGYKKFRDTIAEDRQYLLRQVDENEAYILNAKFDVERAKITEADAQIDSAKIIITKQNTVKQKSQAIIADIKGKSVLLKEANDVPKIEWKMLEIKTDSSWIEEIYNWTKTITNKKWVWQYMEWDLIWKQIFTQDAAKIEAENNNMRVPTMDELIQIVKSINPNIDPNKWWQDDNTKPSIKDALRIKLAGCRNPDGFLFYHDSFGCLWSSDNGLCIGFFEDKVYPVVEVNPLCAFSVFWIKN
jgi:hypothetical protein